MTKILLTAFTFLAATTLLAGDTLAQQTPATTAPSTNAPAASKAPAAKSAQTPATKSTTPAAKTATPMVLKTQKEKASYAVGMNIGKTMKKDGVDMDPAALARGIKDTLAGTKPLLTDEEASAAIAALSADLRKREEEKTELAAATNKKAGEAFLAANKAKDGVVALPSGLQYKIIKEGTGPKPTAADTVVCNYRGTLIDGTEFDNSYKRGQPATFPVGQVIRGWTEAVQLMPVGSKWQIFIPSDLAYGAKPTGPIPPSSTLVFDVELLSIQPKPAASAAPATQPAAQPAAQPQAKPEAQPQVQPQAKP